jgi:signal transduction histidine kinase
VAVPRHRIEDPVKLRRVLEATLLLEADLELPALLGHVIDEARSITGARYGALGVLNKNGTALSEFHTVGLSADQEARIGAHPTGRGVLGLLITDPRPLRLANLGSHPDRYGFPPGHPPMTSFLGVPIKVRGDTYGNLYLTDKEGWPEFTREDEALVEALAVAAGIAIEITRLHQRIQRLAVHEDRDRLARDLHDTVIQRLFAVELSLQSLTSAERDPGAAKRLAKAIGDIDDTITQVRSSIYELGVGDEDRGVRASVLSLVRDLDPVVGFEVKVTFDGPIDSAISDRAAEHLLAAVREAVTNVGRHAQATQASVVLSVEDAVCRLVVSDNGRGMEGYGSREGGLGLGNMRRRAEKLGGQLVVARSPQGRTVLTWEVPLGP